MKRVAVITRTKDRPLMLPRARLSVEQQTFKDLLWVVVNDAGEQGYVEENARAARQAGMEVAVIHRDRSEGMEAASNAGIHSVDSEFLVIHDDDDSWEPKFLERCVAFLDQHPAYLGVITHSRAIFERIENQRIVELGRKPYNTYLESIQIAELVQQNSYAPISFLYRRSAYDAAGDYNEKLPPLADWDFNLRILLMGDIGLVPEMLANYHIREAVSPAHSVYGNSITAGVTVHMVRDAEYRNLKLREDLASGKIGLGFLLTQGRQALRITRGVDFMSNVMRLPQRAWRRVKLKFQS